MKKKVLILVSLSILLIQGCHTVSVGKYRNGTDDNSVSFIDPGVGLEATSPLGNSLLSSGYKTYGYILVVEQSFPDTFKTNIIPEGVYKQVGVSSTHLFFESADDYNTFAISKNEPEYINLAFGDGSGLANVFMGSKDNFRLEEVEIFNDDAFQQTLIYNGVINNILKLEYREYIDGRIRDAFSVPLEFDLSIDNIVYYKGAEIEIIEATNRELKYKIIKGFSS